MAGLAANRETTLSSAVSAAYGETLSLYHSLVVRGTCNAGFLMLPTRASFLASIGETGTGTSRLTCAPLLARGIDAWCRLSVQMAPQMY